MSDAKLKKPEDRNVVTIKVRAPDGGEVSFTMKRTTKMSTVFRTYAKQKGIDLNSMRFSLGGKLLDDTQTPADFLSPWWNEATVRYVLRNDKARDHIEDLLMTETSSGMYSTGSEITGVPIPTVEIVRLNKHRPSGQKKLSFPLDSKDIQDIKMNAERAGVGVLNQTVVNLDVRKTWQLRPQHLRVSNVDRALDAALRTVSRDFGLDGDYKIEARLYKLLLYEPGCFFLRHRDNERLDGMFGTLVMELPSEYEGAELSVWSPLTPNEKTTYSFNGGERPKRKMKSTRPGLHFAAFYADCYHEVSTLTSGHRVALIYHLTANVNPGNHRPIYCGVTNKWREGEHLPAANPSPPQPADESVAVRLARLVEEFAQEGDDAYPSYEKLGKPKKLAIVLSHHYTPASLTSADALKGSDRSIAELIRAAAFRSPGVSLVPRLARLAAKKVVEVGGEDFATNPEFSLVQDLISAEFKEEDGGPFFDAAVSLATVWDSGEETFYSQERAESKGSSTFRTTGPLISLTGETVDLGPMLLQDLEADWHESWFGGQEREGPPFQFQGPIDWQGNPQYYLWNGGVYGEQLWQLYDSQDPGNHSLPIYSHELLFASEEARVKFRDFADKHVVVDRDSPREVEFLGNGGQYPGRIYSRAVMLIWPKAHRRDVQMQSKGGRAILEDDGQH